MPRSGRESGRRLRGLVIRFFGSGFSAESSWRQDTIHSRAQRRTNVLDQPKAAVDHHVHDSLAGFAKDATLPSDPRIVFLGKDERAMHAHADTENPASMQA